MDDLEYMDAGTRAHLQGEPRARAQAALLARLIAHAGLIASVTTTCPWCKARDRLTVWFAQNRAACTNCRRAGTVGNVFEEPPGETERLGQIMRTRPKSR